MTAGLIQYDYVSVLLTCMTLHLHLQHIRPLWSNNKVRLNVWRLSEQKAVSFLQWGLTLRSNSGDPTDCLSSLVVQVRKIFFFLIL